MKRFCAECNETKELVIMQKKETYPVRGENITIDANIAVCGTCGKEVFVRELDFENLEKAYRVYRARHDIVSPDEIRNLRERCGMSQREFAKRLGWSPATVNRYENGALPSPAHNAVLKRLMHPDGFQEFVGDCKVTDKKDSAFMEAWLEGLVSKPPGLENGYKRFSPEKLFNMMAYFAGRRPLSKTALMKHLWYSDFKYFRGNSVSITGAVYAALPHGPALDKWELLLKAAEEKGYINIETKYVGGNEIELVEAARVFDPAVFNPKELETMREVMEDFDGLNAEQLSELSHKEEGWKQTPRGAVISYEYALQINP